MPEATSQPSKTAAETSPEQEILQYISQFTSLSEVEKQGIVDSLNIRSFKKGTLLLREGQVSNLCYFVLKGCIRQYYLVDGEEKTTNFYTEGQPVTPYEGTFNRKSAKYYLSCLEDCVLTVGTPENEARLFEQFPQFKNVVRVAVEEELGKTQDLASSYVLNSPTERYQHLLKTKPDLLDRVPQYQLASFLGVTPESLSRIRRRVMKK
jgi:CRP-like cAMP-binding protein